MESPSFCNQCGSKLPPDATFCQSCGSRIAQAIASGKGMPSGASSSPHVAPEPLSGQPRKTESVFVQSPPIESPNRSDAVGPSGLLTNRIVFVLTYLVFVTPTYVLPYFGSNSALINVTGAAMGLGALPQFWYHLVALYLLVVVAWLRGAHTGRAWIAIFPFLAGIFDMVPGLNWFFLIPTGFHVATLVMGVKGDVVSGTNAGVNRQRLMIASGGLLALIVMSVIKTQSFFDTAEKGPAWEKPNAKQQRSQKNTTSAQGITGLSPPTSKPEKLPPHLIENVLTRASIVEKSPRLEFISGEHQTDRAHLESYNAHRIFDGNPDSTWKTDAFEPHSLVLKLERQTMISAFIFANRFSAHRGPDEGNNATKRLQISLTDDATPGNWKLAGEFVLKGPLPIRTQSGGHFDQYIADQRFDISPTRAKFMKVAFLESHWDPVVVQKWHQLKDALGFEIGEIYALGTTQ